MYICIYFYQFKILIIMKKLLLSALSLFLFINAQAQQLPNNDFENWSSLPNCSAIDSVHGYTTVDIDIYNDVEICPTTSVETTIQKTTDAQSGTYAVLLKPLEVTNPLLPGQVLYVVSPYFSVGVTTGESQGTTFTGRPTSMSGYYKFTNGGEDSLYITALTFNSNDEDAVAIAEFNTTTSTSGSGYVLFDIDFDYDPTKPNAPDSIYFVVGIINKDGFSEANPNSSAYIDNVTFEYGSTTSLFQSKKESPVKVYLSDGKIVFSEDVQQVVVNNIVGITQTNVTTSTKSINTHGFKTGIYLVNYMYQNNVYTHKIVIE